MKTAIKLDHLSQSFSSPKGTVQAVSDVTFSIQCGEVVALLGENGAGKSTLLDMLLGITSPQSGTVELFGTPPRTAIQKSQVGAVLQSGGLLKDLSVKDQIAMVAATYPRPYNLNQVLERANLTEIADRKIGKCSGGQQQRVKFALALLANPSLLVLDEPTAGMDIKARKLFWDSMRQQAVNGATILFSTHYLEEAEEFADRIVLLSHGKLIADSSIDDFRSYSGSRLISFDLDVAIQLNLSEQERRQWGISSLKQDGNSWNLHCQAVEEFLTYLLTSYDISNLEVSRPSLAQAFAHLIQEEN